jgi:polyhydroxyalkanoate synthesis regulator phasin
MSQNEGLKRYLEAALALSQVTRTRAEELVRELIQAGELEHTRAQDWVEDLLRTSRERSEAFISAVQSEVRSQLSDVGVTNLEELAHRVARVLEQGQAAVRNAGRRPPTSGRAAQGAPAKKTTKKGAPAKKATAKRAAAKKPTAKKVAKRPSVGRTAPAKRRAPAKKAAARKKAPAKKVPARKAVSTRKARA